MNAANSGSVIADKEGKPSAVVDETGLVMVWVTAGDVWLAAGVRGGRRDDEGAQFLRDGNTRDGADERDLFFGGMLDKRKEYYSDTRGEDDSNDSTDTRGEDDSNDSNVTMNSRLSTSVGLAWGRRLRLRRRGEPNAC